MILFGLLAVTRPAELRREPLWIPQSVLTPSV